MARRFPGRVVATVLLAGLATPVSAAGSTPLAGNAPALPAAPAAPAEAPRETDAEEVVVPASKSGLAERVLREREILGTRFRGNVFIDGLPVSPDGVQIGRVIELRRARIGFVRQLRWRWQAVGAVELSTGRIELKDFYLRRHYDRLGTVTIGNQSEPMGLNELTSPLSQPLLEPSMATALVPGRNFGVAIGNRRGDFQYQFGVFGSGTKQEGRRDVGSAVTARLTHRSIDARSEVRHFGIALSQRQLDGREQFRSVPEVGIGQEELVDTGTIEGATRTRRAGVEFIQTAGRWSLLGELMRVRVERAGAPQLHFGGAYLEATWMAWGEGPRYDDGDALLVRAPVTESAAWGNAWGRGNLALTARLSRIDLTDADIRGGSETNVSLGATWDASKRSRIAANIVHFIDITGANANAAGSTALAVRFQYAW